MDMIFSPDKERANYNRVKDFLATNAGTTDFIVSQKTLRIQQELVANRNSYLFDFYEASNQPGSTELRLNRNDLFFVTDLALCLAKQDKTAGDYGNYPLFTSPDPNYFIGNDGGGNLEAHALETIYNGTLTIKTSPVERIKEFLTNNFRYVPERGMIKLAAPQIADEWPQYGPTKEGRGYFSLQPNIILDGQDNNKAELVLGTGNKVLIAGGVDNSNVAVDTSNLVVLLIHGYVVENGAQKSGRWTAY